MELLTQAACRRLATPACALPALPWPTAPPACRSLPSATRPSNVLIELLTEKESLKRSEIVEAARAKVGGGAGRPGWQVPPGDARQPRARAVRCTDPALPPPSVFPTQGITVSDSLYSKVVKELCTSRGAMWSLK